MLNYVSISPVRKRTFSFAVDENSSGQSHRFSTLELKNEQDPSLMRESHHVVELEKSRQKQGLGGQSWSNAFTDRY